MFIKLVESGRKSKRSLSGAAFSVLLHVVLISLAIAATASARTKQVHMNRATTVTYLPHAAATKTSSRPAQKPRRSDILKPSLTMAVPIAAPVTVAPGIPEVSPPAALPVATGGEGIEPADAGELVSLGVPNGVRSQYEVDREVRAFPSNRGPVYPDALRSRGIEGEVFVRFVVDESGRVDMKTFEIVTASTPAFANAVRNALERSRFQPAETAGHRVAQLVEQHFQFRLDTGR